jgi:hypothetical protein
MKVDIKGRVRCYPPGRKGYWKRVVSKSSRRAGKSEAKDGR